MFHTSLARFSKVLKRIVTQPGARGDELVEEGAQRQAGGEGAAQLRLVAGVCGGGEGGAEQHDLLTSAARERPGGGGVLERRR